MIKSAALWGVDYISIRPVYWNIAPVAISGIPHSPTLAEEALHLANRLAANYPNLLVKIGNIRNANSSVVIDPGECLAPALTAVITATGDVAACCDIRGELNYTFGNIHDQSFKEIWEGERRLQVLSSTRNRTCDPKCSHAYAYYNQVIDYLKTDRLQDDFL